MRFVLVFLIILAVQQGQAQGSHRQSLGKKGGAEPLLDSNELMDPAVQPDESVATFNRGRGAEAKNKNSVRMKGVKLKAAQWGGEGCAQGSVGAALTQDSKTLSLIFDNYSVQAGKNFGQKRDIKNCSITLPLEVPAGFQFMVVKLDYRGFNSIPKNARTRYLTIYSFLDEISGKQISRRIRRHYDFRGPLEEEYTISSDVSSQPVWSRCGKNVLFRIDTRAVAITNGQGEDVLGVIDSIDASVGQNVQYHLLWQSCT
jgi:hypothetical protein